MSQPDLAALERSLGRVRLAVLVTLGACAAVILAQAGAEQEPVDHRTTLAALALALGSIVLRRIGGSPGTHPRAAVGCWLGAILMPLAVGGLGLALTLSQSARESGLLLAFGGFILALPRPRLASLPSPPKR